MQPHKPNIDFLRRRFSDALVNLLVLLPDKGEYFAAYLKLSCLFIGHNALIRGDDRHAKTAEHSGQFFLTRIHTKTGLGNSLNAGNDLIVLILSIL